MTGTNQPYAEFFNSTFDSLGAVRFNGVVDYIGFDTFCDMYNQLIEEVRQGELERVHLQNQYLELEQSRDKYKALYEDLLLQLSRFFEGACEPIDPRTDAEAQLPWD